MPKPTIPKPVAAQGEEHFSPMLDDVAILVGTELEHTPSNMRFRVECIANWLMSEGTEVTSCVLVLRQKLGLNETFYAVAYEELASGDWINLGL